MAVIRIDPASEEYRQFARLYAVARDLYPSQTDRWNGELYATVDEGRAWGSFRQDGTFKLSKELVLDQLGPGAPREKQVQALASVLHESLHARVEVDAADEPNAVPSQHSKALDEGLTEWVAINGVALYADTAGYGELPEADPQYGPAYYATNALLEYAAGPEGADALADRAVDAPVVMRWDVIADEIVKNRLGDVVPSDPEHQQAARAELINAMRQPIWHDLHETQLDIGPSAAAETSNALDLASQRIRDHYAAHPESPIPAPNPNFRVPQQDREKLDGPQERVVRRGDEVDLGKLPPPRAGSRIEGLRSDAGPRTREGGARPGSGGPRVGRSTGAYAGAGRGEGSRFLSGLAPAAGAVRHKPQLGNGARGAGAPGGGRGGVERPTERGRG